MGDNLHHMGVVHMNDAGRRILGGLVAFLRHGHAASVASLTRGERAVLHRLLEVRPALPAMRDQYKMLLASGVDLSLIHI